MLLEILAVEVRGLKNGAFFRLLRMHFRLTFDIKTRRLSMFIQVKTPT